MGGWLRRSLFLAGCMLCGPAWADEPLVVAPPASEIDITTDFTGSELKQVGSIRGPAEIIVKLVGPKQVAQLSRETRIGPFWVEGETAKLEGAPSLLYLYSTAPIDSILPPGEQAKYGLELEGVPVHVVSHLRAHAEEDWRTAFFRIKERQGYYHEYDSAIRVFGNRLFVADMRLPGDLQTGTYRIETLVVKLGKVVGRHVGQFDVRLSGIERWVWDAAHDNAWLFGSLFTLLAMLLGFALNAIPYRRAR